MKIEISDFFAKVVKNVIRLHSIWSAWGIWLKAAIQFGYNLHASDIQVAVMKHTKWFSRVNIMLPETVLS